jgi:hypothetical protein
MFIDQAEIEVESGQGDGTKSSRQFHRELFLVLTEFVVSLQTIHE